MMKNMKNRFNNGRFLSWFLTLMMLASICLVPRTNNLASPSDTVDFSKYPIPVMDNYNLGYQIAKTMYLLKTSTAEKPNTVKIAVTGQSISDGNNQWVPDLMNWLKAEYPTANIIWKNFAIGGFATQLLYKRVPNDMASFYPDLVICYVYGDHYRYDDLVKSIRDTTTADIMLQTCHFTGNSDWDDLYSFSLMPEIARKYNAEVCQIRDVWRDYLAENGLSPNLLLNDGTHLNASGQKFMLELMKQFFVYRASNANTVTDGQYIQVKPQDWADGKLTIPFTGNRVEVIAGTGTQYACDVQVDNKKPSDIKESYIRSDESRGMTDTNIGIVKYNGVPQEQDWTVEITSNTGKSKYDYKVTGSKTGNEGNSANGVLSGTHLYLDDKSFIFDFKNDADIAPGFKVTFKSILNGTDTYDGSKSVLASGIDNTAHTLVLTAKNTANIPDIKAIKISNPAILAVTDEPLPTPKPTAPKPEATPRTEWIDNGNFEGPYETNMFDSGLDIPQGWSFWGGSSMSLVRGEGVGGSAGGKIVPGSGSQSAVPIDKSLAGKKMDLSFNMKQLTAAKPEGTFAFKIHAYSNTKITVQGEEKEQAFEAPAEKKFYITNSMFEGKTGFVDLKTDLAVPSLSEIKDQNGNAFQPDYFTLEFWNDGNGGTYIIDDISLKSVAESTPTPTPTQTPKPSQTPSMIQKTGYIPVSKIAISKVSGTVKTTAKTIVYKKASAKKGKSGSVAKNKKISVISTNGLYAKIRYKGKTRYVKVTSLRFAKSQKGKVKAATKYYKAASSKKGYYTKLSKNTVITIRSRKGTYYTSTVKVRTNSWRYIDNYQV